MQHTSFELLLSAVERLKRHEARLGAPLFARYWYPFPASDPFAYPWLPELVGSLWRRRGLPAYLLSLGWSRGRGARTAQALSARSEGVFRIMLTVSNFSLLARVRPDQHRHRFAASLDDLRALWDTPGPDGKPLLILSPQYIEGQAPSSPFSVEQTNAMMADACALAGLSLEAWRKEGRIHPRPVVALGRARDMGVTREQQLTITAEMPAPSISLTPSRPYSGMISSDGELLALQAPRGILGRHRGDWHKLERVRGSAVPKAPPQSARHRRALMASPS